MSDRIKESDLKDRAIYYQQNLTDRGFNVEIKPVFAYGMYSYIFNFYNGNDKSNSRQIDTGFGTKKECYQYMENCYCRIIDNKDWYQFKDKIPKDMMFTPEQRNLLIKIHNLCVEASDTIYDDDNMNGTSGVLNLCDQLTDKIHEFLNGD